MRFFLWFFLVLLLICGAFWFFDKPGSGMVWPTGFFAFLLAGCLLYNRFFRGGWLSDKSEAKQ